MKVICINSDNYFLTLFKEYEINNEDKSSYNIRNDVDSMYWYPKNRFETVQQCRRRKLKKLQQIERGNL